MCLWVDGLITYVIFFPAFYFRNQTWFSMLQILQGPERDVENLRLKAEVFSLSWRIWQLSGAWKKKDPN